MKGFKKLRDNLIAELEILGENNEQRKGAIVKETAKYRCSKAKVLSITDIKGKSYEKGYSIYDSNFLYEVGKVIQTKYDPDIEEVCSEGIHYFKIKKCALTYETMVPGDFTGKWELWYDNGLLRSETYFKNGIYDISHTEWYENGRIEEKTYYVNGKKHGVYETWYGNGQLRKRMHYENGIINGFAESWYENGQLRSQDPYVNGRANGLFSEWYENGQLRYRYIYTSDFMNGECLIWYDNGQLCEQKHYKNHKLDGEYKQWDRDGNLIFTKNYKNNQLT